LNRTKVPLSCSMSQPFSTARLGLLAYVESPKQTPEIADGDRGHTLGMTKEILFTAAVMLSVR
jgi:hypothetical protein